MKLVFHISQIKKLEGQNESRPSIHPPIHQYIMHLAAHFLNVIVGLRREDMSIIVKIPTVILNSCLHTHNLSKFVNLQDICSDNF